MKTPTWLVECRCVHSPYAIHVNCLAWNFGNITFTQGMAPLCNFTRQFSTGKQDMA